MKRWLALATAASAFFILAHFAPGPGKDTRKAAHDSASIRFEPNLGRAGKEVQFVALGPGYSLSIGAVRASLSLGGSGDVMLMRWAGGRASANCRGIDPLPGASNYLVGHDPGGWRTNVTAYARVECGGVYPGIDVVYYSDRGHLEYDLVVAPGADPRAARLTFAEPALVEAAAEGGLLLTAGKEQIILAKPRIYQEIHGTRAAVDGAYALQSGSAVGFRLGKYDRSRPLVIDPTVIYAISIGGDGSNGAFSVALDSANNSYITGQTSSTNLPSAATRAATAYPIAFVTKIDSTGTLVYSTYIGGVSASTTSNSVAVDAQGNAYIAGVTSSPLFPVTRGVVQTTYKGVGQYGSNAFVLKLDPSGAILAATYLGGSGTDSAARVSLDGMGHIFVAGVTSSPDFPLQNASETTPGIQHQSSGFVTEISADMTSFVYSTYLGGPHGSNGVNGMAVAPDGTAYVAGVTGAADFPVAGAVVQATLKGALENAFVSKLDPSGKLLLSTYLGGSFLDYATGVDVDAAGNVYVSGATQSADFPGTAGRYQPANTKFNQAGFLAKLDPAFSTVIATYYGGAGQTLDAAQDIRVDPLGNIHVGGALGEATLNPGNALSDRRVRGFIALFSNDLTMQFDVAEVMSEGYVHGIAINPTRAAAESYLTVYAGGGYSEASGAIKSNPSQYQTKPALSGAYRLKSPQLIISKTHSGSFTRGQNGSYSIVVSSIATAIAGPVTVSDRVPSGLTILSMSGSGWNCASESNSCTTDNPLGPASSYPPIMVTVSVAANATSPQVGVATVSGGGAPPRTAIDSTETLPAPVLSTETDAPTFTAGQSGTLTVNVTNAAGSAATNGAVTIHLFPGSGLTVSGAAGPNVTCSSATTCTSSTSIAGGAGLSISATVTAAASAPGFTSFTVTASGGGALQSGTSTAIVQVGGAGTTFGCYQSTPYLTNVEAGAANALVSPINISCAGGTPGPTVPTTTMSLFVNNITSRNLSSGTAYPYVSELLLQVDAATTGDAGYGLTAPQTLCTPSGCNATPLTLSNGHTYTGGSNVQQGLLETSGQAAFAGIPTYAPGPGQVRTYGIYNLRVNTIGMNPGDPVDIGMSLGGVPLANPTMSVATVGAATTAAVKSVSNPSAQCQKLQLTSTLNFFEQFATAFKTRVTPGGAVLNAPGNNAGNTQWSAEGTNTVAPFYQNVPGALYRGYYSASSSGLVYPGVQHLTDIAGLTDSGSRLKATFINIPGGLQLWVSTTSSGPAPAIPGGTDKTPFAVLVASNTGETNSDGANFTPLAGTGTGSDGLSAYMLNPDSTGKATAVWEVTNSDPSTAATLSFSVYATRSDTSLAPAVFGTPWVILPDNLTADDPTVSYIPTTKFISEAVALPTITSCPVQVTINTNPPGLIFTVDPDTALAPDTFTWNAGDLHHLGAPTQGSQTVYKWNNWSNGAPQQDQSFVTPGSATTLTANFDTYYLLSSIVSPAGGGTMVPAPFSSDNTYLDGTTVELVATAYSGFQFGSYVIDGFLSNKNPLLVPMTKPRSVQINFCKTKTATDVSQALAGALVGSQILTYVQQVIQASLSELCLDQ